MLSIRMGGPLASERSLRRRAASTWPTHPGLELFYYVVVRDSGPFREAVGSWRARLECGDRDLFA